MALDGMFIGKLALELKEKLVGGKIDQIDGLNKTDYSFKIRANGSTYNLYMSVSYNNPTIFISPKKFEKPLVASSFTMFLRKYLEGGYIKDIYQYMNDRVVMIDIDLKNDFEGLEKRTICLELIGRFSNLLILDGDFKIIEAIKQLSVLETNSRGIMKGLKYEALKNDKISPDNKEEINKIFSKISNLDSKTIVDTISGISPSLAKYLIKSYKDSDLDFYSFFKGETDKFSPVLKGESDYYYFDIYDENVTHFDTLSDLLFEYFVRNAEAKILKDNNQEVYKCVSSNIKRLEKKLGKLKEEHEKDENADELRLKGELLLANSNNDLPRGSTVEVLNYYTNDYIDIKIDPSKTIKENSQQYYKKYRKAKVGIEYVEREIDIAKNDLDYFKTIEYQLSKASLKDLLEIRDELIENGFIHYKEKTFKKKQKPNYIKLNYSGCDILIGKNNIQNEYITHTLGKKDDLWFHVKDDHGSHVIVSGENKYSEDVIRFASKQAAIYSNSSNSSSVPVDYTEIKYLKKVPGKKGSFVTYKKYKTIYIDPKREEK